MKLIEMTFEISENGDLRIPAEDIADMGLQAGEQVCVAFLSSDGATNDFREFAVARDHEEIVGEDYQSFQLPTQLLEQALIPPDADLQIMCLDGMIVISKREYLEIGDLEEILRRLDAVRRFSDDNILTRDLEQVKDQLLSFIETNLEGEAEHSE